MEELAINEVLQVSGAGSELVLSTVVEVAEVEVEEEAMTHASGDHNGPGPKGP